jgi:hypothetical protein
LEGLRENTSKMKKIILVLVIAAAVILVVHAHVSEVNAKTPYIAFNMLLQNQIYEGKAFP